MANTVKYQRPSTTQTKVADMTTDELQTMIETMIDRKISEWMGDPDTGMELRSDIITGIERQRREYAAGKRGKSLDEIAQRLELD